MAKINKTPYLSIVSKMLLTKSGASAYSTRDPSNGGIGIILKAKNPKFTIVKAVNTEFNKEPASDLETTSIAYVTNAKKKFTNGPLIATNATPISPCFILLGLKGTGFAPPKIGTLAPVVMFVIIIIIGSNIVIYGSICFIGFKVNLPKSYAVRSPKLFATKP